MNKTGRLCSRRRIKYRPLSSPQAGQVYPLAIGEGTSLRPVNSGVAGGVGVEERLHHLHPVGWVERSETHRLMPWVSPILSLLPHPFCLLSPVFFFSPFFLSSIIPFFHYSLSILSPVSFLSLFSLPFPPHLSMIAPISRPVGFSRY